MTQDRRLATIETVGKVSLITGADALESVRVRGWDVVVRKGEYFPGQHVVYFEIDTALPLADTRFSFLSTRGEKTIDGHQYHVLRTVRLRGALSQGLVLPMEDFPELERLEPGTDVTETLGLFKWEPPIPAELSGKIVGPFPTQLIAKTDAERVQNLHHVYESFAADSSLWYATEKIDGTSITMWDTGDGSGPHIASRNWERVWDVTLAAVQVAYRDGLVPTPGTAVQCELFGEGIQSNPLHVRGQYLAVFGCFMLAQESLVPVPRSEWSMMANTHAVPSLPLSLPGTVDEAIAQVDGLQSALRPDRVAEGVVWHRKDGVPLAELSGRSCFKVINNTYLRKQK